jgi:hypothetical protein
LSNEECSSSDDNKDDDNYDDDGDDHQAELGDNDSGSNHGNNDEGVEKDEVDESKCEDKTLGEDVLLSQKDTDVIIPGYKTDDEYVNIVERKGVIHIFPLCFSQFCTRSQSHIDLIFNSNKVAIGRFSSDIIVSLSNSLVVCCIIMTFTKKMSKSYWSLTSASLIEIFLCPVQCIKVF